MEKEHKKKERTKSLKLESCDNSLLTIQDKNKYMRIDIKSIELVPINN
jgi:hypothetical protein